MNRGAPKEEHAQHDMTDTGRRASDMDRMYANSDVSTELSVVELRERRTTSTGNNALDALADAIAERVFRRFTDAQERGRNSQPWQEDAGTEPSISEAMSGGCNTTCADCRFARAAGLRTRQPLETF